MVGFTTTALIAALAVGANAHIGQGCGGHGVMKRNEGGPLKTYVPRAAPTDVASAAQSVGKPALYPRLVKLTIRPDGRVHSILVPKSPGHQI